MALAALSVFLRNYSQAAEQFVAILRQTKCIPTTSPDAPLALPNDTYLQK